MSNLSATLQGRKDRIIKTLMHRRRALVFIAKNRCPLSDVAGRLAEKRRLQHFLTPLSKGGGGRVLGRPPDFDQKPIREAVADLIESLAKR